MIFASKLAYVYLGFGLFLVVLAVAIAVERSRLGYFLTAFRETRTPRAPWASRRGRCG